MRNPSELYELNRDADLTTTADGSLIVALGGFIDAGFTQQLLTSHLLKTSEHEVVARFNADELVDYRGRRPAMVFDTNTYTSYDAPEIVLYRLRDRAGATYFLLVGPEPDYQWERVIAAVRELIDLLDVKLVVTTHGIPMGVPHTRPIGVTAHASDPRLVNGAQSPFGRVQVPGSIGALMEYRLGEQGIDTMGFSVHIPSYLAQTPYASAALTALNSITEATGLDLPNDALAAKAALNNSEIVAEVESNDEVRQIVDALEQQYDAFVGGEERPSLLASDLETLPSADELGAELEQFLREVNGNSAE